jgi:hypothetical protein
MRLTVLTVASIRPELGMADQAGRIFFVANRD